MSDQERTVDEIRALDKDWVFSSKNVFHMTGRGDVYIVQCPINCYDFDWIVGRTATINGKAYRVLAVEFRAHAAPFGKGEEIGLLVHSMNYEEI